MNALGWKQIEIVWRKELRESWKNRKWIWLPLVFILLGVMEPISTYFMPTILKMSGSLPPGTVIHIPTPSAAEVFAKGQSQYSTLGLLILVLSFMGSVANERQQGVLELVMVKPVSHVSYLLAKWLAAVCLTLAALFLGDCLTWYYTVQLIGSLPLLHAALSALVYALWLVLVVTLTLVLGVMLSSATANAFITLLAAVLLSLLANLFKWKWSPGNLPTHASNLLLPSSMATGLTADRTWSILTTAALIGTILMAGISWFKHRSA